MKKWKNFLMHLVSVEYCDFCYEKMHFYEEEKYYILPLADIRYYTIPEDKEFYFYNLTPADSLESIPTSRHYAVRRDCMCPNCGKHYVVFYVYLKVHTDHVLYGDVAFPYCTIFDEVYDN